MRAVHGFLSSFFHGMASLPGGWNHEHLMRINAFSYISQCVCMHLHAYACICLHMLALACICMHMHAYACT